MRLVLSILLLSGFIGCTDASDENPDWKWEDQETEQPEVETKDVWTDVTSDYSGLKEGIRIMKATELMDKPAVAYVAVADMSKVDFGVWGINDPKLEGTDESFKKPSAINSQVDAQVIINGGFFFSSEGKNYSSSLAVSEGTVLSVNINYASEDWVKMYYPTRAAFIEDRECISHTAVCNSCNKYGCGIILSDTQTGLRAIPKQYLETFCEIKGERFEYETNMLLAFKVRQYSFLLLFVALCATHYHRAILLTGGLGGHNAVIVIMLQSGHIADALMLLLVMGIRQRNR